MRWLVIDSPVPFDSLTGGMYVSFESHATVPSTISPRWHGHVNWNRSATLSRSSTKRSDLASARRRWRNMPSISCPSFFSSL